MTAPGPRLGRAALLGSLQPLLGSITSPSRSSTSVTRSALPAGFAGQFGWELVRDPRGGLAGRIKHAARVS